MGLVLLTFGGVIVYQFSAKRLLYPAMVVSCTWSSHAISSSVQ
jgi:hypothetical protein